MSTPVDADRLQHRPYLDGLRAVAVLLVFVFHATPAVLPGGFIGVDLFFVLSGYLITRLLVEEWRSDGRIDLGRFYARRSRRLVPAVILLVSTVVVVEWVFGSVLTRAGRMREAVASLFYAANWNLIATADDYFAEGSAVSPLRHAWSLAVEEQFYLLWPVALLLLLATLRSRRRAPVVITVALAVASATAMAVLFEPAAIARVYYGTDTRIFQPLSGAVVGLLLANRPLRPRSQGAKATSGWNAVAWLLIAGFLAGSVVVNGNEPFYYRGGAVLAALAGSLLVVALERAHDRSAARLLSLKPVVGLGAISYGFYLWHWPVLRWLTGPETASFWERRGVNALQLAATLALALASYRLVEDPVRRRAIWPLSTLRPRQTVLAGILALSVVASAALVVGREPVGTVDADVAQPAGEVAGRSGVPESAPREALALQAVRDRSFRPCPENPRPCMKVDAGPDAPVVAIIGDSTSQAYDPAMEVLALRFGFSYVHAAVGGCPVGHRLLASGTDGELHKSSNLECYDQIPSIYDEVIDRWAPSLVIATSSNEATPHVVDGVLVESGTEEHLRETEARLRDAVAQFTDSGAEFVFVDVLPRGVGVDCLEKDGDVDVNCFAPLDPAARQLPYNALYRQLAAELPSVESISLTDLLCTAEGCPLMLDGQVMRYDGGHLTGTASRELAEALAHRLAAVGADLSLLGQQG